MKLVVVGAGIVGLWQAFTLARRGHQVTLVERSLSPFADAASRLAGAMLAPFCEAEVAEPVVRDLGLRARAIWRETYPGLCEAGTLVLTRPRDRAELTRFARATDGHESIGEERIAALEPALAGQYSTGLYYPEEAHMFPDEAMDWMLRLVRKARVRIAFGQHWEDLSEGTAWVSPTTGEAAGDDAGPANTRREVFAPAAKGAEWEGAGAALAAIIASADRIIDCRGMGARAVLPGLRGVRGEMIIVRSPDVTLNRPVRLLHPRFPIYVVPWPGGRFMIGATVLESEDRGPVSLRSAMELLGTAYALHPAFGEARLLGIEADIRPAFADNVPRILVHGRHIHVNGLYRHGFLTAPALAELVADYLEDGRIESDIIRVGEEHCA